MSAVFESQTLPPTERLIMLALADHADDDGRCYPSIQRLCQRTGLSERAVRTNLRALEKSGYVRTKKGGGRGGTSLYYISANPAAYAPFKAEKGHLVPGAADAPPAADAGEKGHLVPVKGAADAPEPSGTTIEPAAQPREAQAGMHLRVRIIDALGLTGGELNTSGSFVVAGMTPGEVDMHFSAWRAAGLTDDQIVSAIAAKVAAMRSVDAGFLPRSLKFFDGPVRDFAARLTAKPKASTGQQGQQTERDRRMAFYRRVSGATA